MASPLRPPGAHRASPSVLRIRNPLTRVGYTLSEKSAHMLLLLSGEAALRTPAGAHAASVEGPGFFWRAVGGGGELILEGGARGILLTMSEMTLSRAFPVTPLGDEMRLTFRRDLSFPVAEPQRLIAMIDEVVAERAEAAPGADAAVEHLLALLLIRLWRMGRTGLIAHGHAPRELAERFVLLAGQHGRKHWRVVDYARALGVSRDRLGAAVRRATRLSPQAYLHRELVREAASLLTNTGLPGEQIAFRLGFTDPAYFTRFFQRQTGQTPGRFRRNMKNRRQDGNQSFAAWP